jgi:hypothetical protein
MKKAVIALLVIVVVLLVGGGLAAFLFLGTIVKKGVETVGPNITKTSLKLDSATISVFNGSGQLKGFELGNPEGFKTGSAVKVGSIGLALEPRSVLGKKVVIHSIRVEAPEITYEAALGGSNIGKILDNLKSTSSQEKSTGGSKQTGSQKALQVDEFLITGGKINVSASILGGRTATLPLPEIKLANLGQGPEGITPAELSTKVFAQLVDEVAKMVAKDAAKIGQEVGEKAKDVGTGLQDRLKKEGSSVSDLFKSKTK